MLQYEPASVRVPPRSAGGIPGPDVTVTSSAPANKQSSSPTNQLCVQVSAPDDGSTQQYSTGVVTVAADTNPGNPTQPVKTAPLFAIESVIRKLKNNRLAFKIMYKVPIFQSSATSCVMLCRTNGLSIVNIR